MQKTVLSMTLLTGMFFLTSSFAHGHEIFQDVLKKKYTLKSFSCKTCHPDGDDRKIRSMFAELIYQELKDKNYTQQWATAEAGGKESIAAFETMITPEFEKAMDVVGKKTVTIEDLFKHGLINGARLDEKKLAAMAAEKANDSAKPNDDK